MIVLQAATDDSTSPISDRRLFMAGYVATAEHWARFSVAWSKALKAKPAIEYLKASEAANLAANGQFRGWSEQDRDKKLARLARVIERFMPPLSYQVSVSRVAFERIFKPHAPYGLGKPHFVCVFAVVSTVIQAVESGNIGSKVQFIFDRQDEVKSDIEMFFGYMAENFTEHQRSLIRDAPSFEDDTDFIPLQAADLLVWYIRRERELGLPMTQALRAPLHSVQSIEPAMLARWAKVFRGLPGISLVQEKSQWKKTKLEMSRMAATGFKAPHGEWDEIQKATLEHLAKNPKPSRGKK